MRANLARHLGIVLALAPLALRLAEASDCASLKDAVHPDAEITAAELKPAGPFVLPPEAGPARTVQLPSFCRVQGVLRPSKDSHISFEVWLPPAAGWNGRFQGIGNGGFAGSIGYSGLAGAVQAGYAAAASDTGHKAGGTDASWAKGHPEKVVDFGWRAVHVTTVAGKALTRAFYGTLPRRSYFISCSNGGRQGLMEAQRFPDDYDGIIAGAPAYDWTGLFTGFVWNSQALSRPGAMIPPTKMPALSNAVLAQCDELDGLADGLVSAPLQCRFDPQTLKCVNKESDACLTDPQIAALRAIYQGPRTSAGKQIYFGFAPGGVSAPGSGGWDLWIFGAAPNASIQHAFGSNFIKHVVGAPDDWTPAAFNFDRDFDTVKTQTSATFDATDADLSRFAERGGKLILYHGWADAAIPARGTIAYRDAVVRAMGAKRAAAFLKLFMVAGMNHCAGGIGPSDFGQSGVSAANRDPATNLSAALEAWVEHGRVPSQVIARRPSRPGESEPARTGLICEYPKAATLHPGADPLRAENYRCVDP